MAAITGIGTTFTLPNYHGELLALSPEETPLMTAISGNAGATSGVQFEWQTYDLRDPAQSTALEGATAPTAQNRVRGNVSNVVQIHQETVGVSYTKSATSGQFATPGSAPYQSRGGIGGDGNPVLNELDWQTEQALKSIGLDVNWSFINGKVQIPTDNTTPRKTRGLIQACATNATSKALTTITGASAATDTITATHDLDNGDKVIFTDVGAASNVVEGRVYYVVNKSTTVSFKVAAAPGGTAITLGTATVSLVKPWATALTNTVLEDFIQQVFDNGGLSNGSATLLANSTQKRAITAAYAAAYGKAMPYNGTRNLAGVAVDTVLTDFGTLNVMLDRHVPKDVIIVTNLGQLRPVFLNVPGKGVFFEEPLAKTGATDSVMLYGEVGIAYGNEKAHGVLRGLAV